MKKLFFILFIIPIICFGQVYEMVNVNETLCGKQTFKLKHKDPLFVEVDGEIYSKENEIVLDEFCQHKKSLKVDGKLFTGIVYSEYPNGQLKYEMLYKNGTPSNKWFKYFDSQGKTIFNIKITPTKVKWNSENSYVE
jgi:antitoxin component YwqK of YwqJK toxin-antitoxin module